MTSWPGVSTASAASSPKVRPVHGDGGGIDVTAFDQALGDDGDAAGLVDIDRDELAAGLEVDEERRAVADGLEIVDVERHAGFARHGQQVQHGVGRAAGGGHAGDGVVEGLARGDVARARCCCARS